MLWMDGMGHCSLRIALADARAASHPGDCDADVAALRTVPYIARQLDKLAVDAVRRVLAETGGWDAQDLDDHDRNLARLLWIACGDLRQEHARA